jgi:hypothetical protein
VLVRLYAYYIPIWLVVSFAMLMYILVGIKIHRNNVLLHSIQSTPLSNTNICSRTFSHHVTYEPIPTPPPSHSSSSNTNKYLVSTVTISAAPGPSSGSCAVLRSMFLSFQHLFGDDSNLSPSDRTTLAYSRVAFLFFASNLITWVPASINRVYAIQHPATPSFFLNVFAAIVLPLQGLWNCIIYLVVNKAVLKVMFVEWNVKLRGLKKKRSGAGAVVDSGGDGRNIGVDQGRSESTELDDDKMQDLRKALRFY